MSNINDRFIASNFDEVDAVLELDERFNEISEAAYAGEDELVETLAKRLIESGEINTVIDEDDVTEYNPEEDDAVGILDTVAEDYREYVSAGDYSDDDGELIDSIMDDEEYDEY